MDEPVKTTSNDEGEVRLMDSLIILAKYSRLIIWASAAVTILIYLVFFIQPNQYKAVARILPPQQDMTLNAQILDSLGGKGISSGGGGGGLGGFGGMAAGLLGIKSPGDIYVGMMNCDTILDRIIDRFNLMKVYKAKYLENARKVLSDKSDITSNKKDTIITIGVTSKSPELSAEIANAFVAEVDVLLQELTINETKGRSVFLEKELSQASDNLSKAEESLRSFSEKNSVLQIDVQIKGVLEYIARLRAEIDSKEVAVQVLRQQATPFNYDVVRLETEVKGLREKLRIAESQYDNCISDVCLPTNKAPVLALEYIRLYRNVKFREALYQLYIKLVEIARMDMVRHHTVIRVLDSAKPPEMKSNKRVKPAILVGVLTFLIMICMAFVREHMQHMEKRDQIQQLSVLKEYLRPWEDMLKGIKNIVLFKRKS